jgi:hypothetical protein
MRCLWMLEEMGEPYQLIEKSARTDLWSAANNLRANSDLNPSRFSRPEPILLSVEYGTGKFKALVLKVFSGDWRCPGSVFTPAGPRGA